MRKLSLSLLLVVFLLPLAIVSAQEVYPFYYPCRCETGEWGYVNKDNEWTIRPQYDAVLYETNGGMYPVSMHGKWGLVGVSGEALTPITYDAVVCEIDYQKYHYPAIFAAVRHKGKWAFINVQGVLVTGFNYDEILILNGQYIIRNKTGDGRMKTGHLDANGKEIWN